MNPNLLEVFRQRFKKTKRRICFPCNKNRKSAIFNLVKIYCAIILIELNTREALKIASQKSDRFDRTK